MIIRINLVQYSSKFGNSQQQFTVTDGVCKTLYLQYSKILRKMATMKTMATVKSYENKCATNYSIITNNNWNDAHNMQLTKHDTNDDVDTLHLHFNGRVAYMH